MAQRTHSPGVTAGHDGAPASGWSALRYDVFRFLWIATVVSNIGSWMYNAASAWLMTSLNPSPFSVSLVQVANSLPLFLFALPAGALADMIDKRRVILTLEILTSVFSALFALLVAMRLVTPAVLLLFTFLVGVLGALETPAWQAIVPLLVPQQALSSAIATNSVGVNISRVVGPALAGVVILSFGIAAPFWLDAVSNLGVIGVILWWRPARSSSRTLPAEHLASAMRAGVRYARNNRQLRATLLRAIGFFLFASAYWALLPVVARDQLHGGPTLYGVLLGAIGAAAVAGAFLLPRLKAKSGADAVVMLGEAGTAVALVLFGLAQQATVAVLACLIAGVSWIAVLASLNVSAQVALPEWVRGRGLAGLRDGVLRNHECRQRALGLVAERLGLAPAHYIAAGGALVAVLVTRRWRLHTGPQADLTPSMHWPAPVLAGPVGRRTPGRSWSRSNTPWPPKPRRVSRRTGARGRERRRDGAYDWRVFEDTAHPGRVIETSSTWTRGSSICASISASPTPIAWRRSTCAA